MNPLAVCWRVFFASLCSYSSDIFRAVYVHQSRYNGIVQYVQPARACIVHLAQFPTFQVISIFLQIRLDGSNCHIFPPCFIQLKQKIDGSSEHKRKRTLHFLHFSQQYTVHILTRRGKNRPAFFSCARARIRSNEFSPSNMCVCNIAARL